MLSSILSKALIPTVLAIFCFSNSIGAEPSHQVPVLKLKQTHYYWGESEVYLSMQGIRIDNRGRMHFSLVAAAPKWDVTIYRTDDKTCVHETLDQFKATGVVSEFLVKKHDRTIESQAKEKTDIKVGKLSGRRFTNARVLFEYIPLAKYAAPQVEDVIYTVYKLPTNGGIPTKYLKRLHGTDWLSGFQRDGSAKTFITTQSVDLTKISPDLFIPPTGYRVAKSVQEVLLSKDNRDASGDLDVFFESNKAPKKSQ